MFPTQNCSSQLAAGSYQEKKALLRAASCELRARQEGFTLAALIVILTIISLIIAYTVPEQWSLVLKRERDRQTIFLMKQYARAIYGWRNKNGGPPSSLDQLREARSPRMIRGSGKWTCPITGKEDGWVLVPQTAITPNGAPPPPGPNDRVLGINAGDPAASGASHLIPGASPEDYVGVFIGVRPRAKGKSLIVFNGAERYEEWVYTADDLARDIQQRMAAMTTPQ